MKGRIKLFLVFLISFFLLSCQQDPYPTKGEVVKIPTLLEEPLPALSIEPIDILEYKEGRLREHKVRVAVESPGIPIVKIDNLPEGAEFDPKTLILRWRPGFFDGNDPNDPTIKERYYPIKIWLRSDLYPTRQTFRKVNLRVDDVPREILIKTDRVNPSVREGESFSKVITISNADFPVGPFKFLTKGLPASLEVEEISSNRFRLNFKPDYFHVRRNTNRSGRVTYGGKIIVANPANHIQEKEYSITVNDVRRSVKLVAPKILEQGLDASFQVASYDLNREVAPDMELISGLPPFGKFQTELVQNDDGFNSVLTIFWKDIPPRYNGTLQTVRFRACVINSSNRRSQCQTESTQIKLVVRDRTPPLINRNTWPTGELIYLGFNQELIRKIPVIDREDPNLIPRVEIMPEEMRRYVKYDSLKGHLKLRFDKSGVFQFNVKAISDYNMSTSESFIVEVFPKDRKKILLFADSTRDPEVIFYKESFKNTMDIMNPAIQAINQRNISDRETLVLTTSTLLDENVKSTVWSAISKIKNVAIATPLFNALPEKFINELAEVYDLRPIGRYSSLQNAPPIEKMRLQTTKQFRKPKAPIALKRTTTQESFDPLVFNAGLDDPSKVCKGVIGLSEEEVNPLVIGLSCKRKNGGKITLLGTEWADFLTSPEDKEIPLLWFNTLLQNEF